jgi:ATP-dependent DNA ligase
MDKAIESTVSKTADKAVESMDKAAESADKAIESAALESADKAIESADKAVESVDKAIESADKAVESASAIELVFSYIAYDDSEVHEFFRVFRSFDPPFEGAMIRDPFSFYKKTRCNSLLKLKEFYDEECLIRDVVEGEGTDKGLAIFKVTDNSGKEIRVRPKAPKEVRRRWYERKEEVIGKKCTVKYFKKTEEKYIMPVAIVRDYE